MVESRELGRVQELLLKMPSARALLLEQLSQRAVLLFLQDVSNTSRSMGWIVRI